MPEKRSSEVRSSKGAFAADAGSAGGGQKTLYVSA
jgi:hypothetical protein